MRIKIGNLQNLSTMTITLALLSGVYGCGKLPQATNSINLELAANAVNIRDLNIQRDKDATVQLQGTVAVVVPLVDWRAYQLQDKTGKIWVITTNRKLQLKQQVAIKGKLRYHSIPLASTDFGEVYVEEMQRTP